MVVCRLGSWLINYFSNIILQKKIFTSAFIPRIISNIIDKPLSCIIAYIIILRIPNSLLSKITTNKKLLAQKMEKSSKESLENEEI